jgi:phenylacetate-CoA ligase
MAKRSKYRARKTGRTSGVTGPPAVTASQIGPLPDHWPALPPSNISQAMSVFSQMHFIERMPPSQQQRFQLRQVERVLRHAYATVPHYRDKLAGIERIPQGRLDEEFFARIPILTRSDIQSDRMSMRSNKVPPQHGGTGLLRSSGSTGKPIEVAATGLRLTYSMACTLRAQYWHHGEETQKSLDIRSAYAPGTEPKDPRWSILPWSGTNPRLDINRPIAELFEQFIAEDPAYVLSHPYTLMLLAERSRETGILPKNLIEARSLGERLSPRIREVIREVWNVPMVESYSANEVGSMANQCPDTERLHVQVENVRLEVLNDDGAPCQPGTVGRVVVTTLHNFAMPLIRYEIGDYAEAGEPCTCGRSLPVLNYVLGRHRNLCVLKNGDRFFPELQAQLKSFPQILQFQAHQLTLEDIELKVVAARPFTDEERSEVQATIRRKLRYPFNVKIFEVADIPRAANGKFEEFRSDIPGSEIDS